MEPIPLPAEDLAVIDALQSEMEANRRTLEAAMRHHAKLEVGLIERHKEFWNGMAERYDLDLPETDYEIVSVEKVMCIVEVEKGE